MIRKMGRFEHGGDIYGHPGAVDFSANLNPLGMPDAARKVLAESVRSFEAYPDPACRDLVGALSAKLDVEERQLVVTAGASDLMLRICLALHPKRALVTAPCFSGYENVLEQVGARVERFALNAADNFDVPMAFADAVKPGIDLVFVCTPNNPTGRLTSHDVLDAVCRRAMEAGAIVVIDECFIPLSAGESFIPKASRYGNVVVMRAFTKSFSMAGLRLGYGVFFDADFAERVRARGNEWAVSTPAQLAGCACLAQDEADGFLERSRAYVAAERAWLTERIARLGIRVVPSQASYLLLSSPKPLYEPLLDRGVLVRRCANYQGLDDTWFRVAVRTHEENERLVAALKEVCS